MLKRILVTGSMILFLFLWYEIHNRSVLVLKDDEYIIEYGNEIPDEALYYLKNKDKKILDQAKVVINESGIPEVGEYIVSIVYKEEKAEVMVIVKDTTEPEIEVTGDVEIMQGTDLSTVDFSLYIHVFDLSETNIDIDYSNVDTSHEGSYEAFVEVKDKYGNKVNTSLNVIVSKVNIEVPSDKQDNPEQQSTVSKTDQSTGRQVRSSTQIQPTQENPVEEEKRQEDVETVIPSSKSFAGRCDTCGYLVKASSISEINQLMETHCLENGHAGWISYPE